MTSSVELDEARIEKAHTATFGKYSVLVCSMITLGIGTGLPISLSVLFLEWQEMLGVSRAETAVILSTCLGIVYGGAVIPGYAVQKIGARSTILVGTVLASAGLIASAFATSITFLTVSTGLIAGIGFCFIQLPAIPCATLVFDQRKTLVISLCVVGVGLVTVINPPILQYIATHYSWRGAFGYSACVTIQSSVTGMIITSTHHTNRKPSTHSRASGSSDSSSSNSNDNCNGGGDAICNDKTKTMQPFDNNSGDDDDNHDNDYIHEKKESNNVGNSELHYVLNDDAVSENTSETDADYDLMDPTSKSNIICDLKRDKENNSCFPISISKLYTVRTAQHSMLLGHSSNNKHWFPTPFLSKWPFLTDFLYLLIVLQTCVSVAVIFSFSTMLMDFATTAGFDSSTGVFFILLVSSTSICGRLFIGFIDLIPFLRLHSVTVFVILSVPGALALIFLGFVQDRMATIGILSVLGVSLGAQVTIYPKCVLDMKSVTAHSYPLAFGLACTMEGITDVIVPVIIGWSVDVTGSHTIILAVLGSACLVSSVLLACGYLHSQKIKSIDS